MIHGSVFSVAPDISGVSGAGVLRVGLIGTGVVGSGTCQVLARNADLIAQRAGRPIRLVMAAARNLQKASQVVGSNVALVSDPFILVRHPDIDVVVEVMGGLTLAKDLVMEAIANGKHVVTANKALLAEHGTEIFAAADAKGVIVSYEAAVAVSIPIIKALREGLAANRISEVVGIVNGTTNFILSRMFKNGLDFESALSMATELGYAEADPSFDVDGIDAAHKTALLAANAFGAEFPFSLVSAQGIRSLDRFDMVCAQALGYRIKLLGIARQLEHAIEVRVHPTLVPETHLLAQVEGSMNGIWVDADAAGPTFHYGAGAGSETTASAVVADLIDLARLGTECAAAHVPHRSVAAKYVRRLAVVPIDHVISRYYLRFSMGKLPNFLPLLTEWLNKLDIDVQQQAHVHHPSDPSGDAWVFITQRLSGIALADALASLMQTPGSPCPVAVWHVEDFSTS
jgi:homoserine dehydrogenase